MSNSTLCAPSAQCFLTAASPAEFRDYLTGIAETDPTMAVVMAEAWIGAHPDLAAIDPHPFFAIVDVIAAIDGQAADRVLQDFNRARRDRGGPAPTARRQHDDRLDDHEINRMLAELEAQPDDDAEDHAIPTPPCARPEQSTLANDHAAAAEDDDDDLPALWRERLDILTKEMPTLPGLRSTGKAPIAYVLVGWLRSDWKRAFRRGARIEDIAKTVGISPSMAQRIAKQTDKFLAPGGIWNPKKTRARQSTKGAGISVTKPSAISVTPSKLSPKTTPVSIYADGDFDRDFLRFGGYEAIDRAVTSVVRTYSSYVLSKRKRRRTSLPTSPKGSATPKEHLADTDPSIQIMMGYCAATKRENVVIDGVTHGCYDLTAKIHAKTEARLRSLPREDWADAVRDWCVKAINKGHSREKLPAFPYDLVIVIEEDDSGQLHVHGGATFPVERFELMKNSIDRACGKWRHQGKSQRGYNPVLLRRGATTGALGYATKFPNTAGPGGKPLIAMTRDLWKRAKEFYREAREQVLECRRTGEPIYTPPPKTAAEKARDAEWFRQRAIYKKQQEARRDEERAEFIADWRYRLSNADDETRPELLRELEEQIYIDAWLGTIELSLPEVGRALGVQLTPRELVARRILQEAGSAPELPASRRQARPWTRSRLRRLRAICRRRSPPRLKLYQQRLTEHPHRTQTGALLRRFG